jgi:hypothetical protein
MNKKKDFSFLITPQAVDAELKNIEETRMVTNHSSSVRKKSALPLDMAEAPKGLTGSQMHRYYSLYNRDFIKYTLVMHPVGFHRDTFADGYPSLENKMCFELINSRIPMQNIATSHPNGRGGGRTNEHFVFGLLDWSSGQRNRRRVWTDPANQNLPHGPNHYPANQALTQEIWNAFFRPRTVHIPAGVNLDNN